MTADLRMGKKYHSSQATQHMPQQHLLKSSECSLSNRAVIEQALADHRAQIPAHFQQAFLNFQYQQQHFFLRRINYIAQLVFLIYFFADYFIMPDVYYESALLRVGCVAASLIACFYLFRYKKDIRLLDMLLPISTACSMGLWILLLLQSSSPWTSSYIYASVIFVLIANLCIQVRFKPALYSTIFITLFAMIGVLKLMLIQEALVFFLTFIPIFLFSLYISWNSALNGRRNFLRSLLDDWNLNSYKNMAHTDELTQLFNRRQFVHVAERRIHEWPLPASTCLLMFDVDYFKKINDTYGHDVGDRVLQVIADITRKEMRQKDVLARFGGEEFIALLSETCIQDAMLIADRIRVRIQNECVQVKGKSLNFTVSIGVAELKSHTQDLDELVKQADLALYQAKESGRNCIVQYAPAMSMQHKLTPVKSKKSFGPSRKAYSRKKEAVSDSWSIL
ncbi:GGDEF domain-containing protein [Acinetobacter sp.]|jgi:diguanylate cyclase (GGDEF)-like protein|uniref:GGDEF domain-containing protein n=1 Tax=Acinetobacter sp. TaxID=472 RepID=UPI0035B0AC8F